MREWSPSWSKVLRAWRSETLSGALVCGRSSISQSRCSTSRFLSFSPLKENRCPDCRVQEPRSLALSLLESLPPVKLKIHKLTKRSIWTSRHSTTAPSCSAKAMNYPSLRFVNRHGKCKTRCSNLTGKRNWSSHSLSGQSVDLSLTASLCKRWSSQQKKAQ